MYQTGIPACDAMVDMHLQGNIIPHAWYMTITKADLKHPKPHLLAITILSDIAYWYRPTEVRDEASGKLLGYRKKFACDKLQRNYKQISAMYGCSVGQAKEAVVFLENLGVIRRIFRDVTVSGITYPNQMYLDLNVARLRALTYPCAEISPEGGANLPGGGAESDQMAGENIPGPPAENHHYTDTTSNTTSNTTPEITPSICASDGMTDGCVLTEDIVSQMGQLPKTIGDDITRMTAAIKQLTEYDFRRANGFALADDERERRRMAAYHMLIPCLAEMCCTPGPQRYRDSVTDRSAVIDQINRITKESYGSLGDYAECLVEAYLDAVDSTAIKDPRKYLKAMIWDYLVRYPDSVDLL